MIIFLSALQRSFKEYRAQILKIISLCLGAQHLIIINCRATSKPTNLATYLATHITNCYFQRASSLPWAKKMKNKKQNKPKEKKLKI